MNQRATNQPATLPASTAQPAGLTRVLDWVFAPALAHWRALLVLNLVYLAAFGLGVAYTLVDPRVQQMLLEAVGEALSPTGTLGPLVQAYQRGELATAILATFAVNLFLGSLVWISLPSLVIPFWGLLAGVYRAVLWGVLFSPAGGVDLRFWPHALTALIEGEAYVVAMLGVWLWWWPVLRTPGGRWRAWVQGLAFQARVYVAVAVLLAIAAAYEALEVIYLLRRASAGG